MKTCLAKLWWKILAVLVVAGIVYAALPSHPENAAQKAVEKTRQSLRQQGFKTDLADFDFSTSPELRDRETALEAAAPNRNSGLPPDQLNFMETLGTGSVIVAWKQNTMKLQYSPWPANSDEMTWDEFREVLNENQPALDAACQAVLSGPIRFDLDANGGNFMLLPHLAMLKNLTQTLGSRIVLALHDGDKGAAWTNLLAATRLITAWEPEPADVSQLVRFGNLDIVFNATWQALQADGWPDARLARLQSEWESVDFFTNLPVTAAFKRASDVAVCQQERREPARGGYSMAEFSKEVFHSPLVAFSELKYHWNQAAYRGYGTYDDEKALLLFYRDRELELRNAIQSPTWSQMRRLPGVTNQIVFQSKYAKYHSRLQMMLDSRIIRTHLQNQGVGLLGRAAEAEAERRILITAIALERYRGKNGFYPKTLAELAPEFLKTVPVDFMDGQPLRYRLTDDGHFLLYSVGLDCVDNGGKIQPRMGDENFARLIRPGMPLPEADIVWPLPASMAAAAERRQEQLTALQNRTDQAEDEMAAEQWNHTARHQAAVEQLLAAAGSQDTPDPIYHGHHLSELLRNQNVSGTNQPTLGEMLTLKQIVTGAEPETVTFEVPVSHDAVTSLGELCLLIDTNNDDSDEGCLVQQMECTRAGNGNCLLVWSTIYDSPGKHALQAYLLLKERLPNNPDICGPMLPFDVGNLCQFSVTSAHFDPAMGATFRAKLPEANGNYTAEMLTTSGMRLKTITGSTTDGTIKVHWDLLDDHGQRFTGDFFNSVFHITLPDSGRTQTLRGP